MSWYDASWGRSIGYLALADGSPSLKKHRQDVDRKTWSGCVRGNCYRLHVRQRDTEVRGHVRQTAGAAMRKKHLSGPRDRNSTFYLSREFFWPLLR
jgi:hypothetical protein